MTKFKVNNSVSVAHPDNADFLKAMVAKGIIGYEMRTSNAAPGTMVTTPNVNAPLGALNYIRTDGIEALVAPQVSDMIAKPQKNGTWGDETITFKIKEYTGTVSPDDGHVSDGLQVKTNYENLIRGVYYYTTGWYSNDRQEATAGAFAENYRADQAKAAMRTLAVNRNLFFFNGVETQPSAIPVQGLLNAEGLTAFKAVAAGAGDTNPTYWASKTPEEIVNDIVAAKQALNNQSYGLADAGLSAGRGKLILAVATGAFGYLDRTNVYGLTARKLLDEMYGDKLVIIPVPQFNSADSSSDVFYLIYDDGTTPTIINSYVEMARAYPIFVKDSTTSQKISAATSGCIVQYPLFVVRYNAIGATPATN